MSSAANRQTARGEDVMYSLPGIFDVHHRSLASMEHLEATYKKQGRLAEAEHLEAQVAEAREKALP